MRLCKYNEICPHGSGYPSVFGNLDNGGDTTAWVPISHDGKSKPYVVLSTKVKTICHVQDNVTKSDTDAKNYLYCCNDESVCENSMGLENGGKILDSQLSPTLLIEKWKVVQR